MQGFLSPPLRPLAKHLYRLLREPHYRLWCKLTSRYGRAQRFQEHRLAVGRWKLRVPDVASFLSSWKSIFVDEAYAFAPAGAEPSVIDCGANIGLSVLYFKSRFPRAHITAFEADPRIFAILEENVRGNGLADVELVNKAVWSSETTLRFASEGADAGRIETGALGTISVPTIRLRDWLAGRNVDLLKIDIEGAETEVMCDCRDALGGVKAVFVEHHSFVGRGQGLGELIGDMERQGFRVHVRPEFCSPTPFVAVNVNQHLGMDMQLNLYFMRGGG